MARLTLYGRTITLPLVQGCRCTSAGSHYDGSDHAEAHQLHESRVEWKVRGRGETLDAIVKDVDARQHAMCLGADWDPNSVPVGIVRGHGHEEFDDMYSQRDC